jgi:chorismate dehydratase
MTLRVGRIAYLNVAPYFHFLAQQGFQGEVVAGVPAALNRMLAQGEIDICPSSSYEYGLHADDYLLLPEHSISSVGPVHSVLLFSTGPLEHLQYQTINITGESATSVNLLQILLTRFCGNDGLTLQIPKRPVEACLAEGQSALLIGDRALSAARKRPANVVVTDLGALWYHFTGLPFVFALWILRREAARTSPEELHQLQRQLQASRAQAFRQLPQMAVELAGDTGLTPPQLEDYWRSMSYELTDGHLEGLHLYFTLCQEAGLLEKVPEIHFFPAA